MPSIGDPSAAPVDSVIKNRLNSFIYNNEFWFNTIRWLKILPRLSPLVPYHLDICTTRHTEAEQLIIYLRFRSLIIHTKCYP